MGRLGVGVVRPAERGAVAQDAEAGGRAGSVRAVTVPAAVGAAVQRIAVRDRGRVGRDVGVVGVAGEVIAADHLGVGEGHGGAIGLPGRSDRVVRLAVDEVGRVARAAEVRVVEVDAGVDKADRLASARLPRSPRRRAPDVGHRMDVRSRERGDGMDGDYTRQGSQARHRLAWGEHLDAVVRVRHRADHPAGEGRDTGQEG